MTDADRDCLRTHAAAHAPAGCRVSQLVLWLLAEHESLVAALAVQIDLAKRMAERIAAQSELLANRACVPTTTAEQVPV